MKILKSFLYAVLFLSMMCALGYGLEWFQVGSIATVGKAKENARRDVFENTQSYVDGKRQEALKFYQEYKKTDDKLAVKSLVNLSFATFDENKLPEPLRGFIYECKYQ